jgi:F0F1-type ATP synthase membrane subunit b/b'
LKQREDATIGALARARDQANTAEAKSREYEETFQAVRQDSYRLREKERSAALIEREITLKKAREQMQALLNEAQTNIQKEVKAVKQELVKASQSLALEITEAVLARGVVNDAEGGIPL